MSPQNAGGYTPTHSVCGNPKLAPAMLAAIGATAAGAATFALTSARFAWVPAHLLCKNASVTPAMIEARRHRRRRSSSSSSSYSSSYSSSSFLSSSRAVAVLAGATGRVHAGGALAPLKLTRSLARSRPFVVPTLFRVTPFSSHAGRHLAPLPPPAPRFPPLMTIARRSARSTRRRSATPTARATRRRTCCARTRRSRSRSSRRSTRSTPPRSSSTTR